MLYEVKEKEIYWFINNLQGTSVRIENKDRKTIKHFNVGDWAYGFVNIPGTIGAAGINLAHVYGTYYSDNAGSFRY